MKNLDSCSCSRGGNASTCECREPDDADDLTPELDDWASNQDEPEPRDFYSYGRGS